MEQQDSNPSIERKCEECEKETLNSLYLDQKDKKWKCQECYYG